MGTSAPEEREEKGARWVSKINEIIVDNFAGGGGASTGIALAIGRSVDIAINHDPVAIAMHMTNHPDTEHYCENVWDVDPRKAAAGRPVALVWLSPDCKHFSKAKGGKPVEKAIRGLAWVAVRWAATVRPRVIMLENVEEFKTWGPLLQDGRPDPKQKGRTFNCFINALKRQGYQVESRELKACDYGAPTIRKRLFLIARCDGRPIVWPRPTHGDPESVEVKSGKLKPWRIAAEIIDWSLPCPSIFDRKRPLAENTMRRIARGIQKFVVDNPKPFIIKVNHQGEVFRGQQIDEPMQTITAKNGWGIVEPFLCGVGGRAGQSRPRSGDEPLATITTKADVALVTPFLVGAGGPSYMGKPNQVNTPLGTVITENHRTLVAAFLAQYHSYEGDGARGQTLTRPLLTQDTSNRYALVSSHLIKFRGTCQHGQAVTEPMATVTAGGLHIGEVRAFLLKYYGKSIGQSCNEPIQTITGKARFGLVTIHGQDYQIVDIGMRMLKPHELYAAQGFPANYIIDRDYKGNRLSKADQVAKCGNAVPPDFAEALTRSNLKEIVGL
jgi:DNA (cytosine-5)-methyltransferase 1